jgi:hypothetical protein
MSDTVVRQALGACTDYSAYSLDAIWRAVDEVDDRTWPQIAAWRVMATICDEQAAQLEKALAALMQTWKPTRNSAAESFQTTVQHLIDAMRQDSAAAGAMQPVLVGIADELSNARGHIQALIERQNHNLAVEQAHQANPFSLRAQPHDSPIMHLLEEPYPSPAWRDDLQTQAMTTMQTADARIGSLTGQMPVFQMLTDPIGGEDFRHIRRPGTDLFTSGRQLKDARIPSVDGYGSSYTMSHRAPSQLVPFDERVLAVNDNEDDGGPILAWAPPRPPPSDLGALGVRDDALVEGPVSDVRVVGISSHAPHESIQTAIGEPGGGASMGRPIAGGSFVGPPLGGRANSPAGRAGMRPGGRPAVWVGQRRKASSPSDPWAVVRGRPAVIEASEASEHTPGPGVIGIDR